MSAPAVERRQQSRRIPAADEPLARMRMRTGTELTVLDVSDLGTLVEGDVRLVPGARVDVHVITRAGRVLVRSRVVRAFISKLRADSLRYRAALLFDQAVDTSSFGYSVPADPKQPAEPLGN